MAAVHALQRSVKVWRHEDNGRAYAMISRFSWVVEHYCSANKSANQFNQGVAIVEGKPESAFGIAKRTGF
jgi:hypothetical protein